MKKNIILEEYKRMQKLAGIQINENQASNLNEEFNPFLDTTEGGYMGEYLNDVADEEDLDLSYRMEFDQAFNMALKRLKKDEPKLDFNAINTNRNSFF